MSDEPFRTAPAQPQALVALASEAAAKRLALPREARSIGNREERVARALGVRPATGLATILLGMFGVILVIGAATSGSIALGVAGVLMVGAGVWIDVELWRDGKRELRERLALGVKQPFPVDGYELWLPAERPLFDVYLRGDVERRVVEDAIAALDVDTRVEWLGPRLLRVGLPAASVAVGESTSYCGDERAWLRFAEKILAPLHLDVGIERVEMGGTMRALPPG